MLYVGVEADEKKVKQNVQSIDYNHEHYAHISLYLVRITVTSQWNKEIYSVEKIEKKLGHFWVKPRIFEKMSMKSTNHKKCCFL